jgi:hypothetical protein
MNNIIDHYPKYLFKCENCFKDLELGNMIQITITRNPLEDSNVKVKNHYYCQDCWNTSEIFIRGKKVS